MEESLPQRLYVLSLLALSYIVGEIAHFLLGTYSPFHLCAPILQTFSAFIFKCMVPRA
jgi:hypothetical protein